MPSELSTWQNAVSGATAGVVARFVIAPLDVVKIRFQLQTDKKYTSVLQSLRLIVKEEGIFGLFKGNLPAEYLYLTYSAIQFLCYYELDKKMKQTDLSTQTRAFIAGSTAGAIATFITYPLDLLRTRFAIQADGNQRMYPSMLGAIRQIYAAEGLKGFYRGCKPSVLQIMPYMGVMFTAHSIVRDSLKRGKSFSKSADFIAGGVAGIIAKTAVMPFDVVRKRLQVQGQSRTRYILAKIPYLPNSLSFIGTAIQIARTEGFLALYRGLIPSILKAAPASGVTFLVVGLCRDYFSVANERFQDSKEEIK